MEEVNRRVASIVYEGHFKQKENLLIAHEYLKESNRMIIRGDIFGYKKCYDNYNPNR